MGRLTSFRRLRERCFAQAQQWTYGGTENQVGIVSFRWIDAAASMAWLACVGLAVAISTGGDDVLRVWVAVAVGAAVITTAVAWMSRRLDQLETHVYTEGLRAGFDARQQVTRLSQRP